MARKILPQPKSDPNAAQDDDRTWAKNALRATLAVREVDGPPLPDDADLEFVLDALLNEDQDPGEAAIRALVERAPKDVAG